ncbi:M20/M25/M40 family metallo-hydrolase [candidate division KSB1 bacterium]
MNIGSFFRKNILLIIIFLILFPVENSFSQTDQQKRDEYNKTADLIVKRALEDEKGYKLLAELCKIGPRLNGSKGYEKALIWAKGIMEKMELTDIKLQPVMVPHWERGNTEIAEITVSSRFKGKFLSIAALGGSIGTPAEGITGEVIEVKSFEELREVGSKAVGKIIFFNRPVNKGLINTFSGYGGAVDQRIQGAVEAAKAGGIASVVRSVTTKHDNVPHLGMMRYQDGIRKIPSVSIGLVDADFLSEALKDDPALKLSVKLSCENHPDVESYNLMGDLKGYEKPDEIIVVGGHFDAWDKGDGAHDDGGGCIQALEIIDLFQRLGIKPKRTIRCVFFVNEEQGGSGSVAYGEYARNSKEIHYAAVESDRGVFTPRGFVVESQPDVLIKIQSWLPVLKKAHIEWVLRGGSGPDINKIRNAKALAGFVPDDERYFDLHHSANDLYSEVHPREMELGAAAMAVLVFLISEEGLE